MNSVTLTFAANGQQLVRTGCEKFAANTVNYIQAKFDLGEGWAGFDSVRAVWQTDFAKIATVLDNDGNCTVPQEVLKHVNSIMVNLVGSISDGTELTDRLTTYKVKALDVNGATNIDGTETTEVTPSQFEQFVAIVKEDVGKVKDIDRVELNPDYTLTIYFSDGTSTTTGSIRGEEGPEGPAGETGNGIESIDLTGSSGNIDTYTISFTDGSTTTFTVTNGEVTMEQLSQVLPTDTASGSIASFPDGQSLFPMKSLKVNLDPIQSLNGYDSPWVGGAGKNLWQPFSGTARGITFTPQDDGTVAISGTVSQDGWPQILKDYTLTELGWSVGDSFYVYVGNTEQNNSAVRFLDSDGTQISQISNNTSGTVPEGTATVRFIQIGARGTAPSVGDVIDTVGHFYVCRGTTAPTSWTPYSNICPISGRTEVETHRTGINVWDEEWEVGGLNEANGNNWNTNTRIRCKNYIPIIPSTVYFNCMPTAGVAITACYYDANKSFISSSSPSAQATFTTPQNARFMRFAAYAQYGTTYNNDISINYPSTDTDYHAYEGDTYTTALGRTVYGGTLDVVSGELVVDRAMVDLGTLNWSRYAAGTQFIYGTVGVGTNVNVEANPICSNYKGAYSVTSNTAAWQRGNGTCSFLQAGDKRFYVRDDSLIDKTPAEFKSAMNGVQLVYELATPQTIQLTPQEVQTLLGQNNVWSEQGSVAVVYKADIQRWVEKKLA